MLVYHGGMSSTEYTRPLTVIAVETEVFPNVVLFLQFSDSQAVRREEDTGREVICPKMTI
ncbi:hypothetical protein E2C01_048097 [Portunus trituberculatus]|uniref:Uncharacterized protein n=1 Tax=Portunus trituberculatus TaxID=210409 RepID=A0A5B7G9A2_PORTR|nr:hypothetical protein [Portunus trituberculatus]